MGRRTVSGIPQRYLYFYGKKQKFNRKAEFAYQNEEMYAMLDAQTAGGAYPEKELHEGWEVILRNQFHDILPGSSIKEVYDDSKAEYEAHLCREQSADRCNTGTYRSRCKSTEAFSGCI